MSVFVVGAARTPFGRTELSGREHGVRAARAALADAGVPWSRVGAAFGGSDAAGNVDTLVADLGLTGVPFVNVRNGCATGGSALISAVNAIRGGMADVVLAVTAALVAGREPGAEASVGKLYATETMRRTSDVVLRLLGERVLGLPKEPR